eukprot:4024323-Pyramimonas_sp.AAC.1
MQNVTAPLGRPLARLGHAGEGSQRAPLVVELAWRRHLRPPSRPLGSAGSSGRRRASAARRSRAASRSWRPPFRRCRRVWRSH